MKRNYYLSLVATLAVVLSGCVDDAYDLSNLDTSAELKVKGLSLPLKVDEVTLDDVINLEEGGRIRVLNGEYVLVEEGEFESDNIMIDPIHADAPSSDKTEKHLDLVIPGASEKMQRVGSDDVFTGEYYITEDFSNYNFDLMNISEHLISLDRIEADMDIHTSLKLSGINCDEHLQVEFKDIQIHLPKGLELADYPGKYDPETGTLTVDELAVVDNGINIGVKLKAIDFKKMGLYLDEYLHSMTFNEKISLAEGKIVVHTDDLSKLPKQITLVKECDFSDIDVNTFSGKIKYNFDGFDVAPINLNDLPSVLTQGNTDIRIANPQIYLSINNPAAPYKVSAQTGIKFIAHRAEQADKEFVLDNGFFTLGYENGTSDQLFCLSPKMPQTLYPGFEGSKHVAFSTLGNILSGNGLPSSIDISLVNPCIPEQEVENVEIGVDMGKVKGRYVFFSPLALADESIIVYSDVLDGWNSEDLDALTVSELEINTDITSDLPINLNLVGYPIDKYGNVINNVKVEGAVIPANANAHAVRIFITGAVKNLDGIRFEATATSDGSGVSLKPSQHISLKNLKVKVSGNYTTKF